MAIEPQSNKYIHGLILKLFLLETKKKKNIRLDIPGSMITKDMSLKSNQHITSGTITRSAKVTWQKEVE